MHFDALGMLCYLKPAQSLRLFQGPGSITSLHTFAHTIAGRCKRDCAWCVLLQGAAVARRCGLQLL